MKRVIARSPSCPRRWLAALAFVSLIFADAIAGCDLSPQPLPPVANENASGSSGPALSVAEDAALPVTSGASSSDAAAASQPATADASEGEASSSYPGDGGALADAASDAADANAEGDGASDAADANAEGDGASDAADTNAEGDGASDAAGADADATW